MPMIPFPSFELADEPFFLDFVMTTSFCSFLVTLTFSFLAAASSTAGSWTKNFSCVSLSLAPSLFCGKPGVRPTSDTAS